MIPEKKNNKVGGLLFLRLIISPKLYPHSFLFSKQGYFQWVMSTKYNLKMYSFTINIFVGKYSPPKCGQ